MGSSTSSARGKRPAKKNAAGKASPKTKPEKSISAEKFATQIKTRSAEFVANADSLKILAELGISSPLLILGTEHMRVRRFIDWLRESAFKEAEFVSYLGTELGNSQVLENLKRGLENLSLFSKTQLVVIYQADEVKAQIAHALAPTLLLGARSNFIILTASSWNQKTSLLNDLSSSLLSLEMTELKGEPLNRWIQKEVRRIGASGIEPAAITQLVQCYGGDTQRLSQEIGKLSLLTDRGALISKKLVEQISYRTPERTSFELVNQLARKNIVGAVKLTEDLVLQGLHPLQLLSFLSKAFRTAAANKGRTSTSYGEDFAGNPVHPELANPWFIRNLSAAISGFSEQELKAALETLKSLDLELKSSGLPPELSLSVAVQRIASRHELSAIK